MKSVAVLKEPESNHTTIPDEKWTTVQRKKRNQISFETRIRRLKESKMDNYCLGPSITTLHRFTDLDHDSNDSHQDSTDIKAIKPPRIFIAYVSNIQPLVKLLEEIVKDNYELRY